MSAASWDAVSITSLVISIITAIGAVCTRCKRCRCCGSSVEFQSNQSTPPPSSKTPDIIVDTKAIADAVSKLSSPQGSVVEDVNDLADRVADKLAERAERMSYIESDVGSDTRSVIHSANESRQ